MFTITLHDNLDEELHFYRTAYVCSFNGYHIKVTVMANDGTNSTVVETFTLYTLRKESRRPWMDDLHAKITEGLRMMKSGLLEACQNSAS